MVSDAQSESDSDSTESPTTPTTPTTPESPEKVPPTLRRKVERPTISLRLKIMALVLAVAVLPLGVVGYALIDIKTDALKEANREFLLTVLRDVSETIDANIIATESFLASIGQVLTDESLDEGSQIASMKAIAGASEATRVVGIYDQMGARIEIVGDQFELPETLGEGLRTQALANNRSLGVPELPSGQEGAVAHALVVVPLRGKGATWFLAGYVSFESVQKRVETLSSQRFGNFVNSVFVVDERLRAVAHPNRELSETLAPVGDQGLLADFSASKIPMRLEMFNPRVKIGDRYVVSAVISIDSLNWAVVAQLPAEKVFKSIVTMRNLVLTVLLIVLVLAVAASILLAHRLTAPIRALVGFAGDLANRRFDRRVTINTRDELSVLGNAMSLAARDLQVSEAKIKEEIEIRTDLGRYLPASLVERIVKHQQNLELGGERREITVLFADVAGFTPLAESHAAEEVVVILNELFTILTEIVFRYDGTVDKFIGDCVMAFWGAPDPDDEHASKALHAAEDMLRFLELGNKNWEAKYGVRIRLAIGVHTGDAVVGNFGSETRMEYTAVGDVVNLAAHLEAIARPQQILVTNETKRAAGQNFEYLDLGEKELPGRKAKTQLYEVRL